MGRSPGSHRPVSCLPLSGLPSLMQNVSKIFVALSITTAAFRGSRKSRKKGKGLRQGQLREAAMAQKEREGRLGVASCGLLQVAAFRQSLRLF